MKKALILSIFLFSVIGQTLAQVDWQACRLPANMVGKWEQDANTFVSISQGAVAFVSEEESFNFTITGVYRNSGRIMIVGMGVQTHDWGDEPTQLTLLVRAGYGANVIEVGGNEDFSASQVFAKTEDKQLNLKTELGYAHSR